MCYSLAMLTDDTMDKQESAAALQEFLEERPRALEHLTRYLAGHSADAVSLDGTVVSLIPLWRWVKSRIKSYMWQNHPMLAHNNEEVPLAHLLPGLARGDASGQRPSDDDKLARIAAAVIERLNGTDEETAIEDEPLAEVEDLGDDALRGRELEVSLREDIAHEYSRQVDRLVKTLAKEDGITRVIREDREVLLVATPNWSTVQLQE